MDDPHSTTVVQAEVLGARLADPAWVALDCRASLADHAAGRAAYGAGHVPGARHADLERDLSGPHVTGAGRHPWPDAAAFAARLGAWGITPAHQVVAYDAGDGAFAARVWCLLRLLGHARVAVLDGGWTRWQALGMPVDDTLPVPAEVAYAPEHGVAFDAARLLDAEQVAAHLATGGLLLDARTGERFRGEAEPIDRIAGHVPGAANRPYTENLVAGRFKPPHALAAEFRALLAGRAPDELAAMCGSGVTACHHLLAMEHAGLAGAKLYMGSWSGWIEGPSRQVATGD
ncbi:MAG: sulfurtransferase [Pseudomonadota bacterium]|nr:sulfurtransferase [Pseudomonadota bacterium]